MEEFEKNIEKKIEQREIPETEAPFIDAYKKKEDIPPQTDNYKELHKKEEQKKEEVREEILVLLNIAEEKGISAAVSAAVQINDPFVLDLLHDTLIAKGLHKFKK